MKLFNGFGTLVAASDDHCGVSPRIEHTAYVVPQGYSVHEHKIVITAANCSAFGNGVFRLAYKEIPAPCVPSIRSTTADSSVVAVLSDFNGTYSMTGTLVTTALDSITPWRPWVLTCRAGHGGWTATHVQFSDGTKVQVRHIANAADGDLGLYLLYPGNYSNRFFWGWKRSGAPSTFYARHYSRIGGNGPGSNVAIQYYADGAYWPLYRPNYLYDASFKMDGFSEAEWAFSGASGSAIRSLSYQDNYAIYAVVPSVAGNIAFHCATGAQLNDVLVADFLGANFGAELGVLDWTVGRGGGNYAPAGWPANW